MATSACLSVRLNDRVFRSKLHVQAPMTKGTTASRQHHYKTWKQESLVDACKAVADGMTIRRAAEEYGVPRSTLYDHCSGKVLHGAKSGPKSYLTEIEEDELVTFLCGMPSIGYSRTIKQVIEMVQTVVDLKGLDVTVTPSWWTSFRTRHPDLVLREPETLTHSRINGASVPVLENYFDLLETTLIQEKLTDKPCQIYNCDESGFPLSPAPPRVIAKKGEKHPSAITNLYRNQVSVLACCNAAGYSIPPLVIFDRKTLKPELCDGEVPGTMYALNGSGWMDRDIFEAWFANHFLAYVPPVRPILLLMDGHSTHFSPLFVNRAADEDIIVFCLPPHSTHRAQPLDKGVFGPLKQCWREECHSYLVKNPTKTISVYQFSKLFGSAWLKAMTPHNIRSGFEVTGVYPTNRHKLIPDMSSKPPLPSHGSLKFIPLFTPLRNSTRPSVSAPSSRKSSLSSSDEKDTADQEVYKQPESYESCDQLTTSDQQTPRFSSEEIAKFTKRMEEGYDITSDTRYNLWLSLQTKPQSQPTHTVLSKFLSTLPPTTKKPTIGPKTTARIVTSNECREDINEKERKKIEALKLKEERKVERERKREEKLEKKTKKLEENGKYNSYMYAD